MVFEGNPSRPHILDLASYICPLKSFMLDAIVCLAWHFLSNNYWKKMMISYIFCIFKRVLFGVNIILIPFWCFSKTVTFPEHIIVYARIAYTIGVYRSNIFLCLSTLIEPENNILWSKLILPHNIMCIEVYCQQICQELLRHSFALQ